MTVIPLPDNLIPLGRVTSAFGIKGWVKIQPFSDDAEVLLTTDTWWLQSAQTSSAPWPVGVLSVRWHSKNLIAQLEQVSDRDAALALRNHSVLVPRTQFPAPAENEYYWIDLVGCRVYGLTEGQPQLLGVVHNVFDNGAHAILAVHRGSLRTDGEFELMHDKKGRPIETLVPFVDAHLEEVDLSARKIRTSWPTEF